MARVAVADELDRPGKLMPKKARRKSIAGRRVGLDRSTESFTVGAAKALLSAAKRSPYTSILAPTAMGDGTMHARRLKR